MRLISWNVNGIRAVEKKGFWPWFAAEQPDVLCLQETRIHESQLTEQMRAPTGYCALWNHGERRGYSGVATLCQEAPRLVQAGWGVPEFDAEGRVLQTEHESFTLLNVYFPNGQRGQDRVDFKIAFYDALLEHCRSLRAGGQHLIVCGDFNTAHQPIDLARPKQNEKTSGFLPEEREALKRWLAAGFVDVFRHLHPDAEEYTWWTYITNARARNVGWRIDYFLVDEALVPRVEEARILGEVMGSDHCPVEVQLRA